MWAAEQKHPSAVKALLDRGQTRPRRQAPPVSQETTWRVASIPHPFKRRCVAEQRPRLPGGREQQLDFEGVNGRFSARWRGAAQPQAAGGRGQAGGRGAQAVVRAPRQRRRRRDDPAPGTAQRRRPP